MIKNVKATAETGRLRWKIENEVFNTQKHYGYCLEHMYSRLYICMKNHYYLIQIGHLLAQVMEAWERLWKKVKQSREQKHRRIPREIVCLYIIEKSRLENEGYNWDHSIKNKFTRQSCR